MALAVAAGCSGQENPKAATQVAAKVNTDEITMHQVNSVLAGVQDSPPEMADRAKREFLERLVDRQVARQQAIAKNLDRSPKVMQAIEDAKSEILARAYLEQIAASQPSPTAAEVNRYYLDNPELFAQRRLFSLEEIVMLPRQGLAEGLRKQAASARSIQDIAAWLKTQAVAFEEHRGERAAETIPLDLLPKLQGMRNGEFRVVEGSGRLNVFRLAGSQAAPIDEATAAPRIRQLLVNQRIDQAITNEMARYKGQSKIEYLGEFASGGQPRSAGTDANARSPQPSLPSQGPDFTKALRNLR